jgi:hypothetical protein
LVVIGSFYSIRCLELDKYIMDKALCNNVGLRHIF